MRNTLRHFWFRVVAVGFAVLLSIEVTAEQSASSSSTPLRRNTFVAVNPLRGRVVASGPTDLSGTVITLNSNVTQIMAILRSHSTMRSLSHYTGNPPILYSQTPNGAR